ncbi:MAG TPA: zinc-ribbon domain-containing protein, partial [Myxococcota bacterium]
MFCPNCGAKNLAAALTCLDCGRPLPTSPGSPGAPITSSPPTSSPEISAVQPAPAEAPRILRKPGPLAPAPLDNVPRATTTKMATLASQVAAGTAPASVLPPPSLTTPSQPPPSRQPDHSAVSTSSRPAPIGAREITQPFIVHPDITSPLSRSSGSPAAPGPTQQLASPSPSLQPPRTSPSSPIFETAPML